MINEECTMKKEPTNTDAWINATGDCCTGDYVRFKRATFSGSFRNARFAGFVDEEGMIVSDSYGGEKQQHTFTIVRPDGSKFRIKGRNLYREGVERRQWADEAERMDVLREKHARGDDARADREARKGF